MDYRVAVVHRQSCKWFDTYTVYVSNHLHDWQLVFTRDLSLQLQVMLIIIVIIFLLCQLPQAITHLYIVYLQATKSIDERVCTRVVYATWFRCEICKIWPNHFKPFWSLWIFVVALRGRNYGVKHGGPSFSLPSLYHPPPFPPFFFLPSPFLILASKSGTVKYITVDLVFIIYWLVSKW